MIIIDEKVHVDKPTAAVFDYLSDFTTSTEWDPGTVKTVRIEGDGGVGTRYENTSKFAGRVSTVIYAVEELVPGKYIHLRGQNSSLVANDHITVEPEATGSVVTYRAEFNFGGMLKLLTPILTILVKKLGKDGARGMKQALEKL